MRWNISPDDLAKGKLIDQPGWYPVEIISYEEKLSKAGDSTNAIIDFKIIGQSNTGIVRRVWFNEKAPGTMGALLTALGIEENEDGSMSADLSAASLVGRKVNAFFVRGEYEGRPTNEIREFAPLS